MFQTNGSLPALSRRETLGGFVLLALYFVPLPLLSGLFYRWITERRGAELSLTEYNLLFYLVLLLLSFLVFRRFWRAQLAARPRRLSGWVLPPLAGYGIYWLCSLAATGLLLYTVGLPTNLNNEAVQSLAEEGAGLYVLVVVVLAPLVEETLFRGLLFGAVRKYSRSLAYTVSILLFALLHVWQYAVELGDPGYLILMVQYLGAGLALAWVYEKSGSLVGPISLHALINLVAVAAIGL